MCCRLKIVPNDIHVLISRMYEYVAHLWYKGLVT